MSLKTNKYYLSQLVSGLWRICASLSENVLTPVELVYCKCNTVIQQLILVCFVNRLLHLFYNNISTPRYSCEKS